MEQHAKQKVEEKVTPVEKPASEPSAGQQAQKAPITIVRKKRFGFKFLFWTIVLVIFGVGFMVAGIYVANNVIPAAKNWLSDHNFIEKDRSESQTKSPFLQNDSIATGTGLTIPQVVKKTSASVVSIAITTTADLPSEQARSNNIGTGFIIDSSGIIVTNQHVVRDTKATYQIVTQDNKTYTAKNIVRDEVNDIALIIVEAKGLVALELGDSDTVEVGETVVAIGTPLGEFPGSVTVGIISGLGRSVVTGDGFWQLQKEYENVLQTDAAINPGNSGGPLLNLLGEVIGVNFATTGGADNISFALPINVVEQKVTEYKQYGKFRSPYLGVAFRMVAEREAEFYDVLPGALIRSVSDSSPAKVAGLKVGDIITKVNDKDINSSLTNSLGKFKVGDKIVLTVYRSNLQGESETLTVTVTLGEKPEGN
jgi:serine protease Do